MPDLDSAFVAARPSQACSASFCKVRRFSLFADVTACLLHPDGEEIIGFRRGTHHCALALELSDYASTD
jgi:hypothetical protein